MALTVTEPVSLDKSRHDQDWVHGLTYSFLKQQFNNLQIKVGNSQIYPSTTARNLCVIFDSHLNVESHINSVCRSAYFHLRDLRSVRNMLTDVTCSQLIHSLVTVRID